MAHDQRYKQNQDPHLGNKVKRNIIVIMEAQF